MLWPIGGVPLEALRVRPAGLYLLVMRGMCRKVGQTSVVGMANNGGDGADALVIFGITGDLARKMTFRALYRLEERKLLDCPVIGTASDEITAEQPQSVCARQS